MGPRAAARRARAAVPGPLEARRRATTRPSPGAAGPWSRRRSTTYETEGGEIGPAENMRQLERVVLLNITDNKWREHLYEMDYMQEGIHLRAYGRRIRSPSTSARRSTMFDEMKGSIQRGLRPLHLPGRAGATRGPAAPAAAGPGRTARGRVRRAAAGNARAAGGQPAAGDLSDKVPRNAPCPCGSGRKYKKCHGAVA